MTDDQFIYLSKIGNNNIYFTYFDTNPATQVIYLEV